MEYQKIIHFLDNTPNQPTKFMTKSWVEIHDESRGTYNTNSQIKFKTSMLMSNLHDYSDTYILVKGTISIVRILAPAQPENIAKKVLFKNCASFTDCISDNTKYIDVIMPMYHLIEYSNDYSKTSGSL